MGRTTLQIAATLTIALICVGLGLWQLGRADEKQAIKDSYEHRATLPPLDLNLEEVIADEHLYRRAVVQGAYIAERQIFLDNKVNAGKSGYHVVTPLEIDGRDRVLLVDRGWEPWGSDRQRVPTAAVPSADVTISGRLVRPSVTPISFDTPTEGTFEPLWQNLEMERFAVYVEYKLVPLVLELDAELPGALVRNASGYDSSWIERHRAYAVQWFGLAAVATVFFIMLIVASRSK